MKLVAIMVYLYEFCRQKALYLCIFWKSVPSTYQVFFYHVHLFSLFIQKNVFVVHQYNYLVYHLNVFTCNTGLFILKRTGHPCMNWTASLCYNVVR